VNKLVAVVAAAVTLGALVVVATAGAGEPSDVEGDHVILQVNVSPPITSTAKHQQPVGVVFDSREYTDDGQRSTHPTRTNAFRFAGFRFHPGAFAKCLESKLEKQGPSACPKASRLGKGYAIADARPTVPDPIKADALAFNGTYDVDSDGNKVTPPVPAILVYATTSSGLKAYIPAPFKGTDGIITAERSQPANGQASPYTITAVHLALPAKSRKVKGKTVGFLEAPRTCQGGLWQFTEVDTLLTEFGVPATDIRTTHDSQGCFKWDGPVFGANKN
jgi:hypothetical protein